MPWATAAMDLAEHDRTVQRTADVVDGRIALELDVAGLGIDLDLPDMGAVGPGDAVHRVHVLDEDAFVGLLGREFTEADSAVGAGDGELAAGIDDVRGTGLERVGGQVAGPWPTSFSLPDSTAEPPI